MSQENKNVNELELSAGQVEQLDNITSAIESVIDMDNIYTKDRASLVDHVLKLVAELLGIKPSYALWLKVHAYLRTAICKARGMSDDSFETHIWNMITTRLEKDFALVKPSSENPESIKKQEQRKAKQAELDALTDAELEAKGFHKELGARKEKRDKNEKELIKKAHDKFVKDFSDNMKELAKTEYDFAMYLSKNLDAIKKQFNSKK
jgi:hypothetical protein